MDVVQDYYGHGRDDCGGNDADAARSLVVRRVVPFDNA